MDNPLMIEPDRERLRGLLARARLSNADLARSLAPGMGKRPDTVRVKLSRLLSGRDRTIAEDTHLDVLEAIRQRLRDLDRPPSDAIEDRRAMRAAILDHQRAAARAQLDDAERRIDLAERHIARAKVARAGAREMAAAAAADLERAEAELTERGV